MSKTRSIFAGGRLVCVLMITAWLVAPAAPSGAQTLAGSNVDYRINVSLRVDQAELQKWLPADWTVDPVKGGPLKGVNLYNPYKNSVQARISREYTMKGTNTEPGSGSESWEVQDKAGGMLQLRMEYRRAVPMRGDRKMKPRSAVQPSFFRIYHFDEGRDMVKSIPAGIDRVQNYQLRMTLSELRPLFDGTEEIVAIIVNPWQVRKFYLP